MRRDRTESVVARRSPTVFHPDLFEGDVELVVHDDEAIGLGLVPPRELADRAPRVVHVCRWTCEHDSLAAERRLGDGAPTLVALQARARPTEQDIDDHRAHVVPRRGVLLTGV